MRKLSGAILLSGFLLLPPHVRAQNNDESWNNLRKITKFHAYAYADRKGNCGKARIDRVTDQSVTLKRPNKTKITIQRADLLRIGQWGLWPIGTLFSGRSSWYDVKLLPHDARDSNRRARMRIVTSDGKEHGGELLDADDGRLKLLLHGRKLVFAKSDISKVYVMEFRPISEVGQELLVFAALDPEVWISFVRIPVPLYDVSKPEENMPIECEEVGWNSTIIKQLF
jgi:hypothetical protein